jgi:hypothetical protein
MPAMRGLAQRLEVVGSTHWFAFYLWVAGGLALGQP